MHMSEKVKKIDEFNGPLNEFNTPFILQRADPYIYKHTDGTYYFTGSYPAYDRIVLRSSRSLADLSNVSNEKVIWTAHSEGVMGKHIWAPELHYVFGKWYIYFSAGSVEDPWKIRPYVLACLGNDPMEGKWLELGPLKCADDDEFSFRAFSLDATVFENNGEVFAIWAEKVGVGRQISNLYIAKMETADKLSTVQVLLTTPDYDWERVGFWVNEGPAVLKKDGKIFVTYSASATGACYCIGMLTADASSDLLDPLSWKKERNPVLKTDYEKGIYGPGHNSFTKDADDEDICVFHARTYEEIQGDSLYDPNRHTMLLKVKWENDRPVFDFNNILHFN